MPPNADRRMTAEEFDLAASVILLEGGATRDALRQRSRRVESTWSPELVDYFRFISGDKKSKLSSLPRNGLPKLIEGFRLLRLGDPQTALNSFLESFGLGLGSKLQFWNSLALYGIGTSGIWLQHLDFARDAFLRCIESGWALNDHAAVARGFGGLGNLFRSVGRPDLAFDAYSTDLGFIQSNHYLIPILRVRRSLAYAMSHDKQRGLGVLLAEAGDFFDKESEDHLSNTERGKYRDIADQEIYQGLAGCSVVWDDRKTFDLLPQLENAESKETDPLLSIIAYHLAGMYHHNNERSHHRRNAMKAFEKLKWCDHPVRYWLSSLLSKEALDAGHVSPPRAMAEHEVSLPLLNAPRLSFLDRFRELRVIDLDPWYGLGDDVPLLDAIRLTLERGILSNAR